ncbi:MAG TPA: aminomethyl transferase family protein [Porticoccaceae bacterium]|nr:aminomethyl transferase family protein [Porticoccaceae bacterium]
MKKSAFFDFFNCAHNTDFNELVELGIEDENYINWNEFLLPMYYDNAEKEYWAVRRSCALFDVSPIRKIRITGPAAGQLLDYVLTRPVSAAEDMRGIYVAYCHQDGSMKDDSILYKFAHDDYLLMPSDIDHSDYLESFREFLSISPDDLTITECTDDWHGVAVQGPLSALVLASMGFDQVADLHPFEVREYSVSGVTVVITRMGFTADLGYEVWFQPEFTKVFQGLIQMARHANNLDLPGYGLTTLEVCRLEGAFIVAGWDFSTEADPDPEFSRSPFEIGLGWLVDLRGQDFVGRPALIEQKAKGQPFVLRQFKMEQNCLVEDGCAVYGVVDGEDKEIGSINCSAWSWGLKKLIGNVSIQTAHSDRTEASVFLQDIRCKLVLTRGPFVHLARRNQVPAPEK